MVLDDARRGMLALSLDDLSSDPDQLRRATARLEQQLQVSDCIGG
jgi:hypothetical protein